MDADLVVIGAGPGGYTAAIRAAKLGMKCMLIDRSKSPGGTCLNIGCIPSKALLEATELYASLGKRAEELGVEAKNAGYSFPKMMQHKEKTVREITESLLHLILGNKVEYVVGNAKLLDPHTVEVDGRKIKTEKILIASGSKPIALPFLPFDEKRIVSSTGALAFEKVPKRLAVIGAGVIGVELSSVYSRLGAEVTLIEMLPEICTGLDRTIHSSFLRSLKAQGMTFHLKTKVLSAEIGSEIKLQLEGEADSLTADAVLVSVGRSPATKGLGLEELNVAMTARGHIAVDHTFKTNIDSIYAIGDAIEGPMLAHRASEEGERVAEWMAGRGEEIDYILIPNIIYTHPEVASIGFTEEEAKAFGRELRIGTSALKANGRAKAAADAEGLVKIVTDRKSDRVMGIHLFMPHASELIACGMFALKNRMTRREVAELPFGHPTLSEAIKEACQQ